MAKEYDVYNVSASDLDWIPTYRLIKKEEEGTLTEAESEKLKEIREARPIDPSHFFTEKDIYNKMS